jgi:Carboxypeptidase regulatory-like domain
MCSGGDFVKIRPKGYLLAVLCVIALLAAIPDAWGQASTSLRGTVTDPSGAAIPSATVRLTNAGTNLQRTASADQSGNYVFSQVLPGSYILEVEAQGFAKYRQTGIQLLVNLPATVDVQMKIGQSAETVTVTEQAPLLNTTDASIGQSMGKGEIESLPLEEGNVVQLLSLQPGVVYTTNRTDSDNMTDTRSGAVNGERSDQSNVTLDGVDVNDQGNGFAFTSVLPVTIDSVQEFRVSTSNYDAQQGRSAGAEVALVTTGGTNTFHGDAYEFNRTAFGEANDYFIKKAEADAGQPNKAPQLTHNVFGGSIGGPVRKNRLFFFLSYEGHRFAQATSQVREIPTATLRDGVILYPCADATQCPGGSVTGVSGQTYTFGSGRNALGPAQLTAIDPLHIGPSTAAMSYLNSYPLPNDTTVGDGLNFSGFRFAGPNPAKTDWLIARIDYQITANGNHTLFFRGSGRDDSVVTAPEFLPTSSAAENTQVDLSKGFVVGYTALLRSNLVNNLRYGLTKQSLGNAGDTSQPWIYIRNLDQGITRSSNFTFPVHNIVDDLTWSKGNHSLAFGANLRLIYNGITSFGNSFSDAYANASWLDTAGIANTGSPLDPAANGMPAVAGSFDNSYDFPLMGMMGIASEVDAYYNFRLNGENGTALPQGAPVTHNYGLHEYEFYAQDSWKIKPNLTFTYGLRYLFMTPPWDTGGQEVAPYYQNANGQRIDSLTPWFQQRYQDMLSGIPSNQDPLVYFDVAGRSNGRQDLWPNSSKNFAPRIAFAYSPRIDWLSPIFGTNDKTVIRAGFGTYYDHFGEGMLSTFANGGSFGLSSTLTNPAGIETVSSAPRITDINTIPTTDNNGKSIFIPPPPAQFPQAFPSTLDTGGFCICWGLDSSIKAPYSYAIDFSIERELPGNVSVEVGYVGHLGHRLLMQDDLAMPLDVVDKGSGIDYFTAVDALANVYRTGVASDAFSPASVPSSVAKYWTDMLQPLQPGDQYAMSSCTSGGNTVGTTSPVAAMYDLFCGGSTNETTPLFVWDYFGVSGTQVDSGGNPINSYFPITGSNTFYNPQYSSLYAWRSMGFSHYHAFQFTLHKRMSQGFRFDFNYTFSRSIDLASDAERVGEWGGLGGNIINAWSPNQLKGVSDFDLTHQINANWTWQLPFGVGRPFANSVGRGMDALIGGWNISGITRWSTGFPVNVAHGFEWPTNWQLSGEANTLSRPSTQRGIVSCDPNSCSDNGNYNVFANRDTAINSFDYPFPGQSGDRNTIRGDGFFNADMSLTKTWKMPYNESHALMFRWDVFNVFNTKRFDVATASLELDSASTFGDYTHLLTTPRVMEFGLRYQF